MPAAKKSRSMDKMPARKMPESVKMPYKPSGKPKTETMPYKPSSRGGTSAGPVPSEISRGQQTRRVNPPSVETTMERQQKRNVPPSELQQKRKKMPEMQEMRKVKITGTASTKPRVSASLSKAQPVTTAKAKPRSIKSMGNK